MGIQFFVDQILSRTPQIDALELLFARSEEAKVYTLLYRAGVLGPIAQRKIKASSSFPEGVEKISWWKLPLWSGALQIPDEEKVVVVSKGLVPFAKTTHLYYLWDWWWDSSENKNKSNFWLAWHQKKIHRTLLANKDRVICSSKSLATKLGLDPNQVIYPFFKSEDYPAMDVVIARDAVTFVLSDMNESAVNQLIVWLKNNDTDTRFFIFGPPQYTQNFVGLGPNCRYESLYCSGSLQAAFLQSMCAVIISPQGFSAEAFGALASGTIVAHYPNSVLEEVIPSGLRIQCQNEEELFNMLSQMCMLKKCLDPTYSSEARRYALRFSERAFKDKFLKKIDGLLAYS